MYTVINDVLWIRDWAWALESSMLQTDLLPSQEKDASEWMMRGWS